MFNNLIFNILKMLVTTKLPYLTEKNGKAAAAAAAVQ